VRISAGPPSGGVVSDDGDGDGDEAVIVSPTELGRHLNKALKKLASLR
jgi:hypothetical protein